MKKIQSVTNSTVKEIIKLHDVKTRKQLNLFLAEGIRVCKTLIQSPLRLMQLYCTEKMVTEAQKCTDEDHITVATEVVMKKISSTKTASGILGVFSIPQQQVPHTINPGLVLAQISDPGNMGTLIRSAVAFGFPQIIIIDGCDPWSPKVIQACAGTIGFAHIVQLTWDELKNHKKRPALAALVPHDGKKIELAEKNKLLIVGNEAHGIPEQWLADCEEFITLPMPGNAESLNAAVAGSIALYLSILR